MEYLIFPLKLKEMEINDIANFLIILNSGTLEFEIENLYNFTHMILTFDNESRVTSNS
jgi:hypothetical protein